MRKTQRQHGFTLIELLLYISISAVLLFVMTVLLGTLLQARIKSQTIAEVDQQGVFVVTELTQTLRDATAINAPAAGAASTLSVATPAADPVVFELTTGTVYVTEGAGSPIPLTNSNVVVSDLTFENLSASSTPGIVRTTFTVSYSSQSDRYEYVYSKVFTTSTALRP